MLAHLRPQPKAVFLGIRHCKDVAIAMAFTAIQEFDPSNAAVLAAGRADDAMLDLEAAINTMVVVLSDESEDGGAEAVDMEGKRLIALTRILERDAVHAWRRAETCLTTRFHGKPPVLSWERSTRKVASKCRIVQL